MGESPTCCIEVGRNRSGECLSPDRASCGKLMPMARVPVGFRKLLRAPDGKTRFLTPKFDERGVCREEDEVFSFGHAQQQAVERITVRLRGFHARQDVFVGYRQDRGSC